MAVGSPVESRRFNHFSEIADLLRGDYKQSDYGKVILPLTVLRCLDWFLEEMSAGRVFFPLPIGGETASRP